MMNRTQRRADDRAKSDDQLQRETTDLLRRKGLLPHETAAAILGIPPATLHTWNSQGVGPRSYKIGRYRKYRLEDLDAFIESKASDAA